MRRSSLFLALIAGIVASLAFATTTQAGPVLADSGGGSFTVTGTATGGTLVDVGGGSLTDINGLPVSSLDVTLGTITLTDTLGVLSGTGTKVISETGSPSATLGYSIIGFASGQFVLLSGTITSVSTPATVSGFDFSDMLGGGITISINKPGANFNAVFANAAGPVVTSVGYGLSEAAPAGVPEPTSMALLGVGMAGFFAFRRLFKRPATV